MELDISALLSPAAVATMVGFLLRYYFEKQSEILSEVSKTMQDVQLKIAVHETRAGQVEKILSDFERIREEFTREKSRIEAAWRMLDALQEQSKLQNSEVEKIKSLIYRNAQ